MQIIAVWTAEWEAIRHWLLISSKGNVGKIATRWAEPIRAVETNVTDELPDPIEIKSSKSAAWYTRFSVGWRTGLQIRVTTGHEY